MIRNKPDLPMDVREVSLSLAGLETLAASEPRPTWLRVAAEWLSQISGLWKR